MRTGSARAAPELGHGVREVSGGLWTWPQGGESGSGWFFFFASIRGLEGPSALGFLSKGGGPGRPPEPLTEVPLPVSGPRRGYGP